MSGTVTSNVFKASGVIAATPGGLDWSSAVITGSTLSAETGRGYFINTTSNACTITLPASPAIGDQIVFADYARTWSTNNVIIDSNGLNFQGDPDTYTVDYDTAGQSLNIVYSDATKGWLPVSDDAVADVGVAPPTQRAVFAYGNTSTSAEVPISTKNLVNSSGVVAADVTGVGTVRDYLAAASYGTDKAIFGFGYNINIDQLGMTNLVNNEGVIGNDVAAVGTARAWLAACGFGGDKAIFCYGGTADSNLVNNQGVVASDVTAVGTNRSDSAGVTFGGDKGIFGFGKIGGGSTLSITNLVSNLGVVSADVTGVGTARTKLAATSFGGDKAIFGYGNPGSPTAITNKVSNLGVVASDTAGVGTARSYLSGAGYGGDKGIFAYGVTSSELSMSNLVNSSGVVGSDVTGVGTARHAAAAAGYSTSA